MFRHEVLGRRLLATPWRRCLSATSTGLGSAFGSNVRVQLRGPPCLPSGFAVAFPASFEDAPMSIGSGASFAARSLSTDSARPSDIGYSLGSEHRDRWRL